MKKGIVLLFIVAMLAGCGSARNIVTEPIVTNYKSSDIEISSSPGVDIPGEARTYFDKVLKEKAHEHFAYGNHLKMTYKFVSYEEGSRLKRYLSGGIGNWGEGTLLIQADFTDAQGKHLGSVRTDARISSGFFGGSIESALDMAAEKLVEYAVAHFK